MAAVAAPTRAAPRASPRPAASATPAAPAATPRVGATGPPRYAADGVAAPVAAPGAPVAVAPPAPGAIAATPSTAERPSLWSRMVSAAGEFIADRGWDMVRALAPGLEPLLQRGPLQYLKDRLSGVFDGLVGGLRALVPVEVVDLLGSTFGGLVARASTIVAGLASGDCQPLFDAINELKTFVTEVATAAWDRITTFLQPIGDFFTGLWAGYGAPAVEWLQQIGGEIWAGLQQLGTDIYNWTEPIRRGVAGAWSWLKTQLFGPEDPAQGESSGGIVGWITRKAGEAFDWIKEQTRPVWQPIADAAQTIRAMLPPAFVTEMGANMQQLAGELNQTAAQMEEGAHGRPIAENREALAGALPSVRQVIRRVRSIISGAGGWLLERLELIAQGVRGFMEQLRGNSLIGRLAGVLGWLEQPAMDLLAWGRDGVVALFDWLLQGFDSLTPFVERVLRTVQRVIQIAGDILQLPMLLAEAAWNLIPCCIRDPIKEFVVTRILSQIPVFGQFFSDPTLWPRVQQTALEILRDLFVDGNIARAAWTFFQAMLRILNLPPELVVRILAKAAQAIGDVLADPIGFLNNLLRALKQGFGRFFDNIFSHLLGGVATWLFSQAESGAGIRPPADFSLRSIFGFVLDVFGITVDNVLHRLGNRVGHAIAQRVRQMLEFATGVWNFVKVLIDEGPAGLWREIQQRLANLWDTVLNGVVNWVMGRVVARATRWLMGLLDVTGITPVINTLVAVYNAIESAVQYMRQMLEIVSTVCDGIIDIAHARVETAAGFVERALGDAIPVVVGFLANQFGFGNIGEHIQEIVAAGRARVDQAIDSLIDGAIRVGQSFLNMLRRGVAAVRSAAGAVVGRIRNWWAERVRFRGRDNQPHQLYFRGEGAGAELIVESEPQSFASFLRGLPSSADKQLAEEKYSELREAQRRDLQTPAAPAPTGAPPPPNADAQRVVQLTHELGAIAARLIGAGSTAASSQPRFGPLQHGYGTEVTVETLTSQIPPGSEPSVAGAHWESINYRRSRRGSSSSYYVRGHLLNHNLGGVGHSWANLTPLTQAANNRAQDSMLRMFETPVKNAVLAGGVARNLYIRAQSFQAARAADLSGIDGELQRARTGASGRTTNFDLAKLQHIRAVIEQEQYIPRQFTCYAEVSDSAGRRVPPTSPVTVDNAIDTSDWKDYEVSA